MVRVVHGTLVQEPSVGAAQGSAAPTGPAGRTGRTRSQHGRRGQAERPPVPDTASVALEDAVERVRELSLRLWAVRSAHPAVRSLLGRLRCATCAAAYPCPTLRATGC